MNGKIAMLNPLLPRRADNTYRGHRFALVLFGLLLLMKLGISLSTLFNGRTAATSADGIPLDSYTPAAAQTVVSLFALWGLTNLVICIIGLVVLIRYRGLVSFMFALFLFQQLGRYLVLQLLPIVRTGAPPGFVVNLVLLALMVVGLALSLWRRNGPASPESS
jgi:hypothetical protein